MYTFKLINAAGHTFWKSTLPYDTRDAATVSATNLSARVDATSAIIYDGAGQVVDHVANVHKKTGAAARVAPEQAAAGITRPTPTKAAPISDAPTRAK